MVEDWGEKLAREAAEDPLWVECPRCNGSGFVLVAINLYDDALARCPECKSGRILNPQLEP